MNCDCRKDIMEKLSSIPEEWRIMIAETICQSVLEDREDITCEEFRECETLTELSDWSISGQTICITYKDEKGISHKRCFEMIIPVDISSLDPNCIALDSTWKSWTPLQQWQALIDKFCDTCIPTTTTTTSTTTTTTVLPIRSTIVCTGNDSPTTCECTSTATVYSTDFVAPGVYIYEDYAMTIPYNNTTYIGIGGYYYEVISGLISGVGVWCPTTTTTTTTLPSLIGAIDVDACLTSTSVTNVTFNGTPLTLHSGGGFPVDAGETDQYKCFDRIVGTLVVTVSAATVGGRIAVYRSYLNHPTTICQDMVGGQTTYTFNNFDMTVMSPSDEPFYVWLDCLPC